MRQYCRYCNNLVAGNGIYCEVKNKEISESTAKSINHCKDFEFNKIDAFFETSGYKPRKAKVEGTANIEQLRLDDGKGSETE